MRSHSKGKQLLTRRLWGSIHWQWAKEIANKISKLGEPRQVKPHVKNINSKSSTLPAPFIFFKVFSLVIFGRKHILAYQCEIERKINKEREEWLFFVSCSKSWRIYEAILSLWRHCLERFFSQLKVIIDLKLTSNLANTNNVHSFWRVSGKREMVNIVGGHIINI